MSIFNNNFFKGLLEKPVCITSIHNDRPSLGRLVSFDDAVIYLETRQGNKIAIRRDSIAQVFEVG